MGSSIVAIQTEGEGNGLSVVEDMVMESNNSDGKGEKEDSKITQKCELK